MRAPLRLKDISEKEYKRIIQRSTFQIDKIMEKVISIVDEVRKNGDEAVLKFTREFDKVNLSKQQLILSKNKIRKAYSKVPSSFIDSVSKMRERIEDFHKSQIPKSWSVKKDISGAYRLGEIFPPVQKAGVYVPGGKACYPSTAVMGCVPARLAGVLTVVVCTPPSPSGDVPPEVIVASDIAGADVIVNAGGAQAIAALAFGTESIPKVDVIAGPGNIYVNAAKSYLFSLGRVGIDCPAGPSEVLIIADDSASPSFIIWDMLAQAEHDEMAWAVLVTPSQKLADKVWKGIEGQLEFTERKSIIQASLENNGYIILVDNLDEAVNFANEFAPEHLEILTENPDPFLSLIKNAGSVFLGENSPVAAGDYFSGTNHILPTGGTARFFSGCSVHTFLKRITYQNLTRQALAKMEEPVSHLSHQEGFQAHLKSIQIRLK
mgnify:CR=1 FL=1